jgi:hypothetical protein
VTLLLAGTVRYGTAAFKRGTALQHHKQFDSEAFSEPITNMLTAVCFSVVTIAAVGYGDIAPQTDVVRLLAPVVILCGAAYSIFFFSIIAGFVREPSPPQP